MYKQLRNRVTEIKVVIQYEDFEGLSYDALAYVIVNSNYEVEAVRFSIIECFDKSGEPLDIELPDIIREWLEVAAGNKALEKVQSADFEKEHDDE